MNETKSIHLHINIYIDGQGNVSVTNAQNAQSVGHTYGVEQVTCSICGKSLGIARNAEHHRRKLAGHTKHCKGSIEVQALRSHAENIFGNGKK